MDFGQVLLMIFLVFLWVVWIFMVVMVLVDVFRSDDLSGWGKAGWTLAVVFFTWIGVLAYVIVRGQGMHRRRYEAAAVNASGSPSSAQEDYLRSMNASTAAPAPAATGSADEIAKLSELRDRGVLTDEEFQAQKAKLLG